MPPISVLIKPASSNCNLRCSYCFYFDEVSHRNKESFGLMKQNTIETIIKKSLEYATGSCFFGFQGGEPTLAGLDFFKQVINLQKKYNKKQLNIKNAIQTNGILIDDLWASFFAENNFLVGVSLDGHESLHNLYRKDIENKGSFKKVMQGIDYLRKNNVEYNILTVVTAQTAKNIGVVYPFFMKNGFYYQQYIPCLDPIGEMRGQHKYSLTPQLYARFLKKLFDMWYEDRKNGRFIYIRYFENLLALLLGYKAESCDMNGLCSVQYAIEADGSVFPCDFYMLDDFYLGNMNEDSFEVLNENRNRIGFIEQSLTIPQQCQKCSWLRLCRIGCLRNRLYTDATGYGPSYFCESYKEFYPYAIERLLKIVKDL